MHVLEIVSMLLAVFLSMIVRLPNRHDNCICNYRQKSSEDFEETGRAPPGPMKAARSSPAPIRRLQGVGGVGLVPLHVARRSVDRRDRLLPGEA